MIPTKRCVPFLIFLWIFIALGGIHHGSAQTHRSGLDLGINLYRAGKWSEAAWELRRSQMEAANPGQLAESLYWISLTEFSLGEYAAVLRDINDLQRIAPAGLRINNILYYKGRSLYYLERHNEALVLFRAYANFLDRSGPNTPGALVQKSVLAYWIGECLFSLGQQDQAVEQFTSVVNARPRSEKYEAAFYRIALIRQNKIQAEILDMLNWSYDEYLKNVEEYRQREEAYDKTIDAYRTQVDRILLDASQRTELEAEIARYQKLLAEAEAQIHILETSLNNAGKTSVSSGTGPGTEDNLRRIRELKASAERLRNDLNPR
jgi:tetratricopeptide (TPR) repeat protein